MWSGSTSRPQGLKSAIFEKTDTDPQILRRAPSTSTPPPQNREPKKAKTAEKETQGLLERERLGQALGVAPEGYFTRVASQGIDLTNEKDDEEVQKKENKT